MKTSEGESVPPMCVWKDGEWKTVYTPQEVAKSTSYSEAYVLHLCREEKLIAYKIRRQWWIPEQWYKNIHIDLLPF